MDTLCFCLAKLSKIYFQTQFFSIFLVLIVNVDCIIESRSTHQDSSSSSSGEHQNAISNSRKIHTHLKGESTSEERNDVDTCDGKSDGYYVNSQSACTSYYYCAAGYQLSYICGPGKLFDGTKCSTTYTCPLSVISQTKNWCDSRANGYYVNNKSSQKYFYCFHQVKVMDLSCDTGKIFVNKKCQVDPKLRVDGVNSSISSNTRRTDSSCEGRNNGFYQDIVSHCKKYFYCIDSVKTSLQCDPQYVFNGDICVHLSEYECPSL